MIFPHEITIKFSLSPIKTYLCSIHRGFIGKVIYKKRMNYRRVITASQSSIDIPLIILLLHSGIYEYNPLTNSLYRMGGDIHRIRAFCLIHMLSLIFGT